MFENFLIESAPRTRTRSPWATAASATIHVTMLGVVTLVPLVYTQALPSPNPGLILTTPPSAKSPLGPAVEIVAASIPEPTSQIVFDDDAMIAPRRIPDEVAAVLDAPERLRIRPVVGAPGRSGTVEIPGVVPGTQVRLQPPPPPTAPPPAPEPPNLPAMERLRVSSGIAAGNLIRQVQPAYPRLARTARIDGVVILEGVIFADGAVGDLRVVSGHPLLTQAAMDAIAQWVYTPYVLNGSPIEIVTTFTLTFRLD